MSKYENIALIFSLLNTVFLAFSVLVYIRWLIVSIIQSSKFSIGAAATENLEMLKFIPDHLKTEKICKHVVKKLPFVIRYVSDQYNTQQMCDKAILENGGTESVPDCYKNQQMCDKVVDNYPHTLKFVPGSYVTRKMCDEAVNTYGSIQFVPDCYRLEKCVIKLLIDVFLHFFMFLIDVKLKKRVIS